MSNPTPHKHIGFSIRFDELIPEDTIEMRAATWKKLHLATAKTASSFQGTEEQALANTDINASVIGPLDGPDAGTGPLIPVGSESNNVKQPFAGHDEKPNVLSPVLEDGQDEHAGETVSTTETQPYPTSDVPAVPTSAEPEAAGPTIPQPPAEVFADSDGKTIGVEDGNGGFEHVRDNPFPPDHAHDDLTGKSIRDHI